MNICSATQKTITSGALVLSLALASCARAERVEPSQQESSAESAQAKPRSIPVLEADPNSDGVAMGKPLFSCGYANFSWSHVAYGNVVDDQGRIWSYDLASGPRSAPLASDVDAESRLKARFPNPVLQSRRVPAARLASMKRKAEVARDGRIEKRQASSDAGGSGCDAYLWEKPDAYEKVELGSTGNVVVRNLSPEASELQVWLQGELGLGLQPRARRE